jgi:hypothetical protein
MVSITDCAPFTDTLAVTFLVDNALRKFRTLVAAALAVLAWASAEVAAALVIWIRLTSSADTDTTRADTIDAAFEAALAIETALDATLLTVFIPADNLFITDCNPRVDPAPEAADTFWNALKTLVAAADAAAA